MSISNRFDPRHLQTACKKRCFVEQFFRSVVRSVVYLYSIYFRYLGPWGMVSAPYILSHHSSGWIEQSKIPFIFNQNNQKPRAFFSLIPLTRLIHTCTYESLPWNYQNAGFSAPLEVFEPDRKTAVCTRPRNEAQIVKNLPFCVHPRSKSYWKRGIAISLLPGW